jgi:hypothetical protein
MSMRLLASVFAVATIAGASASAAFAGEVTGNGEETGAVAHANSICVFSGKNDNPAGSPEDGPGGVSQSYGQENKLGLRDPSTDNPGKVGQGEFSFHPGFACNGEHGFFAGGGGE